MRSKPPPGQRIPRSIGDEVKHAERSGKAGPELAPILALTAGTAKGKFRSTIP